MTEDERKSCENLIHEYVDVILNQRQDDRLLEFLHPDFKHDTDESALGFDNTDPDVDGIRAGMEEMREKLDPTYAVKIVKWEGDAVHLEWTFDGIHKGKVMGLEPTGKPFTIHFSGVTRFRDGKIIEAKNDWDPAATLDLVKAQIYA